MAATVALGPHGQNAPVPPRRNFYDLFSRSLFSLDIFLQFEHGFRACAKGRSGSEVASLITSKTLILAQHLQVLNLAPEGQKEPLTLPHDISRSL